MYRILLLFVISINSFSQSKVSNWRTFPIPTDELLFEYNHSDTSWLVSLDKYGNVIAESGYRKWDSPDILPFTFPPDSVNKHRFRGARLVKKVDDGFIVTLHRGEWGGDVYWFSTDGCSHYRIAYAHVISIVEFNSEVLLVEGLSHLSVSRGSILRLTKKDGKWIHEVVVELPSAPEVSFIHNTELIIVASDQLIKFNGKEMKIIKDNCFWGMLYPESALINENQLYIGMRGGVYKLDLGSLKEEWLMPN